MGSMEDKFAQATIGTKNEEQEELAVEKKSVESAEAVFADEDVEKIASDHSTERRKASEEFVIRGEQSLENVINNNVINTGNNLGLKMEDVDPFSKEAKEELEALKPKEQELSMKAEKEISKVMETQPEASQEAKINAGAEVVKAHEAVQVEFHAKNDEAIKEIELNEVRKKETWKSLSKKEQLDFCNPEAVAQNMRKDLQLKKSPEQKPFSGESFLENSDVINENIRNLVEGYITEGKIGPEYGEKIRKSTEDYVNLVVQAQKEGSVEESLKAVDIQKISEDIANKMVYQNRESLKRGLGDHGVRHIIDGNIAEAMKMVDTYNKANPEKPMTALDRLKIMTVHFNHDMGYTVEINTKGMDTLGSHPMFSKKLLESQNELYGKLFNKYDLAQMETIIESHDKSRTDFTNNQFESIIRLSDNLGLFQDSKLPEIFYSVPENIAVLQKIDLAIKSGQPIKSLQGKLKENVQQQHKDGKLDEDTYKALLNAADEISDKAPEFNLGMMAGELEGYEMQGKKMVVNIRESDMHQQIKEIFELNQKQFVKALDSYGIKLDEMKTTFDQYVKTDADGTRYVDLPVEGEPALRFNFLPEDLTKQDNRNIEIKKKFKETIAEWKEINIREGINATVEDLKNPENRTRKKVDTLTRNLIAQCRGKMNAEDETELMEIMSKLDLLVNEEKEFEKETEKIKNFATKQEKKFLAVE